MKTYIFIFLVFCVFSSKHIIIYNEEILVLLSFFLFVTFVSNYFGHNIKESLDERNIQIQKELAHFCILKRSSLETLSSKYQALASLKKALQALSLFTIFELKKDNSQKKLKTFFLKESLIKLKNLKTLKASFSVKLQETMAKNLLNAILVNSLNKPKKVELNYIQNSIKLLKKS